MDYKPRPGDVRVRVPERQQVSFACLDDLIEPEHVVRMIWDIAGRLDLSKFYQLIKARTGVVGRDANDPRMLVALWLFAATEGVGSARELDRLCREHRAYQWLCGGVSVNYHTLADFRVGFGNELDELFTQVIASLVERKLIRVHRISQDGTRVRACAGASSFRRKERLNLLLKQAREHMAALRARLEDPAASAELSARQKAAAERAAKEREQRLEQALSQLPALEEKQKKLAKKVSAEDKKKGKLREPRASTGDSEARVMKMSDGGFRPAVNVQLAVDTASRLIVGVDAVNAGVDTGQLEPMRQQVQERTGLKVAEHLADGGFLTIEDVEHAAEQGVTLYMPPKPPRNKQLRGSEYEPRPEDSEVVRAWRARMGSEAGKAIYPERASTVETVNADLKAHRGLVQLTVRGLARARCVALWCALAYNLMHAGRLLTG